MKCCCCGKTLDNDNDVIDEKGCHYIPAVMRGNKDAYIGRVAIGHGKNVVYFTGAIPSPKYGAGKPPRPFCPACFLKKLRRAVAVMEDTLEGKDFEEMAEQDEQEEQKPQEPEVVPDVTWIKVKTHIFEDLCLDLPKPPTDEQIVEEWKRRHAIGLI